MQLLRHLRMPNGGLKRGRPLDIAVATATMCDLFLAGRITEDAGSWVIDTEPTQHPPTNDLLSFVGEHADIALNDVAAQAPSMVEPMIDWLVATRMWGRTGRGRFEDYEPATLRLPLKDQPYHLVTRNEPANAFDCCLAVLLYPWREMSPNVLTRCGPAGEYLTDYVSAYGVARIRGINLVEALLRNWQPG